MPAIVEGPKIAALSCGKPAFLVVLLHGQGSEGSAFIEQALNWAPTMPKADFVAAEAPFTSEAAPGRHWFPTTEAGPVDIGAGLQAAAPLLDAFLDEALARRRLPDSHLALVGFSHGAMLALHVGLRRPRQMAAIVAFSAALESAGLAEQVRSRPPTLMIHGDADPVVPIAAMTATKEVLKGCGVPAVSRRRPGLGHAIDDDGILLAGEFLTRFVVHKPAEQTAEAESESHDHH